MAVTSETWAYVLGPDYQCRGTTCDAVAEFKVVVPEYTPMHLYRSHNGGTNSKHPAMNHREEEWGGNFCRRCLTRTLEIRLVGLHFHQPVSIERINRA